MSDTVNWQVRDLPLETRKEITAIAAVYDVRIAQVIEAAVHLLREHLRDPDALLPTGFDQWAIHWMSKRTGRLGKP
jgi:hypothetical protein